MKKEVFIRLKEDKQIKLVVEPPLAPSFLLILVLCSIIVLVINCHVDEAGFYCIRVRLLFYVKGGYISQCRASKGFNNR